MTTPAILFKILISPEETLLESGSLDRSSINNNRDYRHHKILIFINKKSEKNDSINLVFTFSL